MTKHRTTAAPAGGAVVVACGGGGPGDAVSRVALASADGATSLQQELVSVVRAVSPSVGKPEASWAQTCTPAAVVTRPANRNTV
jgi:hypothetical protein